MFRAHTRALWKQGRCTVADADPPPVEPALAKVTIFEVAERPWGLMTSAEVGDRIFIGSKKWREQGPLYQCRTDSIRSRELVLGYRWRAGPSLGFGSHIEAQIGTQFSLSGPIAGFLVRVEDAQRLRLPSAPSYR